MCRKQKLTQLEIKILSDTNSVPGFVENSDSVANLVKKIQYHKVGDTVWRVGGQRYNDYEKGVRKINVMFTTITALATT